MKADKYIIFEGSFAIGTFSVMIGIGFGCDVDDLAKRKCHQPLLTFLRFRGKRNYFWSSQVRGASWPSQPGRAAEAARRCRSCIIALGSVVRISEYGGEPQVTADQLVPFLHNSNI